MTDIEKEYNLAYVEVLEIIKHWPSDMASLIPKQDMEMMNECKDKNYKFEYNNFLPPEEQEISEAAKATLVYLYQKYIDGKYN